MPKELSCILVKKADEGTRPSMHTYRLSGSTVDTNLLLNEVKHKFTSMVSTTGEEGALLSPLQATQMIEDWRTQEKENSSRLNSHAVPYIDEMLSLAKDGHSMLFFTE